jgi:Beta propeller domain
MQRLPGTNCRFLSILAAALGATVFGTTVFGVTGCTSAVSPGTAGRPSGAPAATLPARLVAHPTGLDAFGSCGQALAGLRRATAASVTAYGLPDNSDGRLQVSNGAAAGAATSVAPAAMAGSASASGASASGASANGASANGASGGSATPAYSGTNVAVAGVDEPDLVKTDGRRIVLLGGNLLTVVDAATRRIIGSLRLGGGVVSSTGGAAGPGDAIGVAGAGPAVLPSYESAGMLLSGDHVLVIGGGWGEIGAVPGARGYAGPAYMTHLLLVDLSGGSPRVISTYSITGQYVDARMVGSVVRVVTRTAPRVIFPVPSGASAAGVVPGAASGAAPSQAQMVKANRAAVARASLGAWLPSYVSTSAGATAPGSAAPGFTMSGTVPCTSVSHPATYSGTDLLTVETFDLSGSLLGTGLPVSIEADGDTVYGTASSLYIASGNQWSYSPGGGAPDGSAVVFRQQTQIYRFSLAGSGAPQFAASGVVPGYLVDQYALSEWSGYLRVATTSGLSWAMADGPSPAGVNAPPSSSAVYELSLAGTSLRIAGKVTGLGSGERIYSVRFVGPVGYVVTFRQTDPLYTVDLSNPLQPQVVGSLALTGYSAYLHPVSATELIGIGQSADGMGHIGGIQVSLFSVADLAAPARLATYALASGSSSLAEFDPHAFLYWPADGLVVVPLIAASGSGDLVLRLSGGQSGGLSGGQSGGSLVRVGLVTQPVSVQGTRVERSLIVGSTLWTVSPAGLMASDLSTLQQEAWLSFP